LVVLGDVDGCKDEIIKISESHVNFLISKNLIIATFYTAASVSELKDYFILSNRNFLIFEMNEGTYATHINDAEKNKQLFEDIKKYNNNVLRKMGDNLIREIINSINLNGHILNISGTPISDVIIVEPDELDNNLPNVIDYINSLSETSKIDMINSLIDRGVENLSDYDKKCLTYLTNKK
jgi:hypothetical protein